MELETLKEVTYDETYDPVDGVGSEIALLDYPLFGMFTIVLKFSFSLKLKISILMSQIQLTI